MDDNPPVDAGTSRNSALLELDRAFSALTHNCQSSSDIATKLADMGCYGHPLSPSSCPIARYLRIELGVDEVVVSTTAVTVVRNGVRISDYVMPVIVARFQCDFDGGAYPYLLEGRTGA